MKLVLNWGEKRKKKNQKKTTSHDKGLQNNLAPSEITFLLLQEGLVNVASQETKRQDTKRYVNEWTRFQRNKMGR